jgi:TIR domain
VLIKVKEKEPKSNSAAGSISPARTTRRVVFLNHANPEDNVFALWLGARLTAAGYHVWTDLLQLVGGERFWKDINEAIRQHTAVFLPILSNASIDPAKEGVFNEIAIATNVRRDLQLDNFIVPLKLQRIPEIPAQLIQLNYIDFTMNWVNGLAQLLERLEFTRRKLSKATGFLFEAFRRT